MLVVANAQTTEMLQALQIRVTRLYVQRMQRLRRLQQLFSANLLLVNTGTCCGLYVLGDLCQQRLERKERIDWMRTGRMAVLGFCLGPVNHYWYRVLDRFLPGSTGRVVAQKVLLDQTVMAPLCCSLFYIGMTTLEGGSRQDALAELRAKFWPTYKMDWQIWPAAQAINFFIVPSALRVTYVNVVTFGWTVYLSYMKHRQEKRLQQQQQLQPDKRTQQQVNSTAQHSS